MQAIPTSEPTPAASIRQLFAYPFRIFFLSMTVLTLVTLPAWVLQASGTIELPLALPGLLWHQHEMLFGFLTAAIAGFLLTAVCVWTQTPRTHGVPLLLLWLVWLGGRLLLAFGAGLPEALVQGINLAFLPLVMIDAGWRIWHARQKRQIMILVVLGLLWALQIAFVTSLDMRFSQGALIMAMALISIIGGRITPAFSKGWLNQRGLDASTIQMIPALDLANLACMILLMISLIFAPPVLTALLALVATVLVLVRLYYWKGWLVRQEPLLWVLHLSILWIPVALVLLSGSLLMGWPANAWAHAAGAGAVGCIILGVIARVSLGHTGRPLVLPRGMVIAFVMVHLAALLRVLTAFEVLPWHAGIGISTLLWLLAYGTYLVRYTGILATPRPDGKEG